MNTNITTAKLQECGFIFPNGEVNGEKLNYISSVIATSFIQNLWELFSNNRDSIIRLYNILSSLYEQDREREAVEVLHLLYNTMDMEYPADVKLLCDHNEARSSLLYELLSDLDEIIQDLLPDE